MTETSPVGHGLDVLAVVPDLLFASRISALLGRMERSIAFARSREEVERMLAEGRPRLVLIDLGARGIDPRAVIRRGRIANVERIVVFGPHKDLAARAAALEEGADRWISNQRLLETLPELLT